MWYDSNRSVTYTIQKRSASVDWHLPENLVYDGEEHQFTYTLHNVIEKDKEFVRKYFKYKEAREYAYSLYADFYENYDLENASIRFTVAPAAGSVEFFVNRIPYDDYDTAVRVGDTVSWKGNAHIWSVSVYLNGEKVYPDSEYETGGEFVYSNEGSYEIQAAGDYVFEIDIGGDDDNTTRRTVTFKISGVLESEEVEVENN